MKINQSCVSLSPSEVEARPQPQLESTADPEDPAPVVGRPLRSRGKTPTTTPSSSRTSSSHHHTVGWRFNKAKPSTPGWCVCILPSSQYTLQFMLLWSESSALTNIKRFQRPPGGSDWLLYRSQKHAVADGFITSSLHAASQHCASRWKRSQSVRNLPEQRSLTTSRRKCSPLTSPVQQG